MPTPAFSSKVIDFNRLQKTGKHYTNDEITRRREAEEKLKRKKVTLKPPAFLKEKACSAALKIWKEIVKESAEIELFDNVDSRILANYCRYQALFEEEAEKFFPDRKNWICMQSSALPTPINLGLRRQQGRVWWLSVPMPIKRMMKNGTQ